MDRTLAIAFVDSTARCEIILHSFNDRGCPKEQHAAASWRWACPSMARRSGPVANLPPRLVEAPKDLGKGALSLRRQVEAT